MFKHLLLPTYGSALSLVAIGQGVLTHTRIPVLVYH